MTSPLPSTPMYFFADADAAVVRAMAAFLSLKDICRCNEALESSWGSKHKESSPSSPSSWLSSSSLSSSISSSCGLGAEPISGVAVTSEKVFFPSFLAGSGAQVVSSRHYPPCPASVQSAQAPFQEMMRRNGEVGIYDHLQNIKRFLKWIRKYRLRLTSMCFDGYCDSYMSIVFSQFLGKPNNPTTASLESLSLRMCTDRFGTRYRDLMNVIATNCTNLRELDMCSADIRLSCFLNMVRQMQVLERVMLRGAGAGAGSGPGAGVGAVAKDRDDDAVVDFWTNLVATISPRLTRFVVDRSFRCSAPIDRATFVAALKSRCPNLQHIQIEFGARRKMGQPLPQDATFQYSWSR